MDHMSIADHMNIADDNQYDSHIDQKAEIQQLVTMVTCHYHLVT